MSLLSPFQVRPCGSFPLGSASSQPLFSFTTFSLSSSIFTSVRTMHLTYNSCLICQSLLCTGFIHSDLSPYCHHFARVTSDIALHNNLGYLFDLSCFSSRRITTWCWLLFPRHPAGPGTIGPIYAISIFNTSLIITIFCEYDFFIGRLLP